MKILKKKNGFTMIELLLTLVVLAVVVGMALTTLGFNMDAASEKTEEVFVKTLEDTIDAYVSGEFNNLSNDGSRNLFIVDNNVCSNKLNKIYRQSDVKVIKFKKADGTYRDLKFSDIINSSYYLLTEGEFVNPANEGKSRFECDMDATIKLYRDSDYVYYYYVDKSELDCLNNTSGEHSSAITNLPSVDSDGDGVKDGYYTCS